MNDIREKIKQGYDSTELPEELRLRVRREFLAAAESKKEGGITMSKKIKKPAAIGLIAAAALTVTVTAGAMTGAIFHKESIDIQLGAGAADKITSDVEFSSYSVENDYLRVTADAVFCDGKSVAIFLTTERLTDPNMGWVPLGDAEDGSDVMDMIGFDAFYEDGTNAGSGGLFSSKNIEATEDGVQYARFTVRDIEPGRPIVLTAHDISEFLPMWHSISDEERNELIAREDYDEYIYQLKHPASVAGLSLTIDTEQNVTPITFANEEGRELHLTPYHFYTSAYGFELDFTSITLINSSTGEELSVALGGGGAGINDYLCLFSDYIDDIEQYDTLILDRVGEFHRQ